MALLDTPRLSLHRFTSADAAFLVELLNDPAFLRFIGDRKVRTVEDAERYVANGPAASYERHGFGLYLVRRRDDDAPIGMCGLLKRDTLDDVDLGFAFMPDVRRRGYAREAASAVMTHARSDFALTRLAAIVSPGNDASIATLGALGFSFRERRSLAPGADEILLYVCDLAATTPSASP